MLLFFTALCDAAVRPTADVVSLVCASLRR
jgi:hypothetical protein